MGAWSPYLLISERMNVSSRRCITRKGLAVDRPGIGHFDRARADASFPACLSEGSHDHRAHVWASSIGIPGIIRAVGDSTAGCVRGGRDGAFSLFQFPSKLSDVGHLDYTRAALV